VTDISKWLHHFFGLAFLNPEDVGDSFAEDLIPDMPSIVRYSGNGMLQVHYLFV
jgi:hypothetical protein